MSSVAFAAVSAETGKELKLAMQRLWLSGEILPVGARLRVLHTFRSEEDKPLEVIYAFPLPRDAALRRFRVAGEGFSVRSELKPVEEAVKIYERGIEEGRLSTLAREYADGLANLSLGNVRPGETVTVQLELIAGVETRDDGIRFRFPFTLAPGYHPRARVSGAGEMELPEDEFEDLILPRWMREATDLHEVGFELAVRMEAAEIGSPSHAVRSAAAGGEYRVRLSAERDVPDRDLVLDIRTAASNAVISGVDGEGRGRFAVVVPSTAFGALERTSRRIVLVLDRSGSMEGAPLRQARRALEACLSALEPDDRFGLVAFDDRVESFGDAMVEASAGQREAARQFLKGIGARGGTELAMAVTAAASLLGPEGGDLLVLTDGQVFGTEAILAQARSTGARLHCLGIGSASQDRFLALLARETGGVSRFVTPRERVDVAAVDLFASIGRPVVTAIRVNTAGLAGAVVAPAPPASVLAGQPLVIFGEAEANAEGKLAIEHDKGALEIPVAIGPRRVGETLRLLQGARLITDLEARPAERKREGRRVDKKLEDLSRAYGLASRAMALVAVVERQGDRPGEVPQTRVVPVGMPQDVQFGSYFGARAAGVAGMLASLQAAPRPAAAPGRFSLRGIAFSRATGEDLSPTYYASASVEPPAVEENPQMELAARMEVDGGMPGRDEDDRLLASVAALLEFLEAGNNARSGPFRRHVERLIAYLESALANVSDERQRAIIGRVLEAARAGTPLGWRLAGRPTWEELDRAL